MQRLLVGLHESPTRWLAYGVVAGVGSGIVAVLFFVGLEFVSHQVFGSIERSLPSPPGEVLFGNGESGVDGVGKSSGLGAWIFFVLPAIGGLISGLLVTRFAPEAAGHGTDEMIRAFHRERGQIRPRIPLVKGLATIATLATGGSAGKEGPIAQIGAGIGSVVANWLGLSARDRRILLLAGAAGGLGAIFRAPLGSALTAIEVLYQEDFESDALIPCVISSVTAYAVFVSVLGSARIFAVPAIPRPGVQELVGYLLLSLLTVPIGGLYIRLFYGMRDKLFSRLPVPRWLKPMIGGVGVGLLGIWVHPVYGSGWGYIQQLLNGELVLSGQQVSEPLALVTALSVIVFAKILATCLTIGSGGSGGVFGPTLFIGGMLGGVVGFGGNLISPTIFPVPEAYVLVGMASFFAGVASAPIGAMLMVTEMTGGYTLLPPLMLASVVAILFMRRTSIYENQVRDRFQSPAHVGDLTLNVLEEMKVDDVYSRREKVAHVIPEARFGVLRDAILVNEEATLPVVSEDGELVGIVTAEQLRPVMDDVQLDQFVVARDICAPPIFVRPDDDLYRAHELFRQSGCPQLPVLGEASGNQPAQILGMLDYRDMMLAYGRELVRRKAG